MKFRVFFRLEGESIYKTPHHTDKSAYDREDAMNLVKIEQAKYGRKIKIITATCISERQDKKLYLELRRHGRSRV